MTRSNTIVWIDARQAVIVHWQDAQARIVRIESDVPAHHRATGHVRHDASVRPGGGVPKAAGEPHRLEHLAQFIDEVAGRLPDGDDLVILGPGTVRERLERDVTDGDRRHGRERLVTCGGVAVADRSPAHRAPASPGRRGCAPPDPGRLSVERAAPPPGVGTSARRATPGGRQAVPAARRTPRMTGLSSPAVPMRVLVAIDGSGPASRAVELVGGLRWPAGTTITVAQAVESGEGLYGGLWPAVAMVEVGRLEADIRSAAEQDVAEAAGQLVRPGLTVDTAVLRGRPATAIGERARAMGADLIVVGSRGHGRISSMLLGSVSSELVDHAPAPVLVARGSSIDRILLAWDGSSCAARAAELLQAWPVFAGSSIRVVSVADIEVPWWTGFPEPGSPELMPTFVEAAEASRRHRDELVLGMTDTLRSAGLSATGDRLEGDAATELLARANATKTDLIVLGTHGRTGLARLVIGSVARNVLHHATSSVLVVRENGPPPDVTEPGARLSNQGLNARGERNAPNANPDHGRRRARLPRLQRRLSRRRRRRGRRVHRDPDPGNRRTSLSARAGRAASTRRASRSSPSRSSNGSSATRRSTPWSSPTATSATRP